MSERKEGLVAKLTRARGKLMELVSGLDAAALDRPVYAGGEMQTVADILRHLMDAESGIMLNCRNIIAGGEGVPADFDRDRYNDSRLRKTRDLPVDQVLEKMDANRAQLLEFIAGLDDEALDRKGRHAAGVVMPVENHLRMIGLHEQQHARDIRRALE